jgi:hypothetical protein
LAFKAFYSIYQCEPSSFESVWRPNVRPTCFLFRDVRGFTFSPLFFWMPSFSDFFFLCFVKDLLLVALLTLIGSYRWDLGWVYWNLYRDAPLLVSTTGTFFFLLNSLCVPTTNRLKMYQPSHGNQNCTDSHLFRKKLSSASPECLSPNDKYTFILSMAGSYIGCWVLGIRDRHQDNMMIKDDKMCVALLSACFSSSFSCRC